MSAEHSDNFPWLTPFSKILDLENASDFSNISVPFWLNSTGKKACITNIKNDNNELYAKYIEPSICSEYVLFNLFGWE